MLNDFVLKCLKNGIDHYNFKRIIFSGEGIKWLKNVSYKDIIETIEALKENSIGLYVFLPFCYLYLGINSKLLYLDLMTSKWGNNEKCKSIARTFNRFPFKLHFSAEREKYINEFNQNLSSEFFANIQNRLIREGAKPIDKLEVILTNQKVTFDLKLLDNKEE